MTGLIPPDVAIPLIQLLKVLGSVPLVGDLVRVLFQLLVLLGEVIGLV